MKYTLDHLLLISVGVCSLGSWSLFIIILTKIKTYNDILAVVFLVLIGGWVGFSVGVGMLTEATDEDEDENVATDKD